MADKVRIKAEIERRLSELSDACVGQRYAYQSLLEFIGSLPEETVKGFTFKAIPRLLDMIPPSVRAKTYIGKLSDTLENEGYHTDAKIVRETIRIMNGDKVGMATMDEESVNMFLNQ